MQHKYSDMAKYYRRKKKEIGLVNVVFVEKMENARGWTEKIIVENIIYKCQGMEKYSNTQYSIGTYI